MFQSFEASTKPETAKPRLTALRAVMTAQEIDAFLVPRADKHQGEYVAKCDERLAYISSFTGSAGHAAITLDKAALFVDGRYTIQAANQVDAGAYEFRSIPDDNLADWLNSNLPENATIGIDPWVHTNDQIDKLKQKLRDGLIVKFVENPLDASWSDRPEPPENSAYAHPIEFSGQKSGEKRALIASTIRALSANAAVITLPDSICWMLNIRGADIVRMPVVQCFAIVDNTGAVQLFLDPEKVASLGTDPNITPKNWTTFETALADIKGPIIVDENTAPIAIFNLLEKANVEILNAPDPCILPKACKNQTEIAGSHAAHLRDGAAVCNFLCEISAINAESNVTEIDLVKKLEGYRADTNQLKDISFETICGTGPHGAIVHYRVTNETNRTVKIGDVLLIDSGGQYLDGTTDITRTVAIGPADPQAKRAFTLVLKGMIAISCLRFPRGLAGRDIDPIARHALWQSGMDFDHGTGHGVGSFLSVHEGPQGISRRAMTPFKEGMIVSNEPGYYKENAFGIRIENLVYVKAADDLAGANARDMLAFETLTLAPIDKNMIDKNLLIASEIEWLNTYHALVLNKLSPLVNDTTKSWLKTVCTAL